MNHRQLRQDLLAARGATASEIEELLVYNENRFDLSRLHFPLHLPLPPEPHVSAWERYTAEAARIGVFPALKKRLIQLHFPIRRGISETAAYRRATRRGAPTETMPEATGLSLRRPQSLELFIHSTWAGRVPVIVAPAREDFVTLVRALLRRNEPKRVPPSIGAVMVAGFNNWDRIRTYRAQWETRHPNAGSEAAWQAEFRRLIERKELYQDRLMLLSEGPYSGVSAAEMGLEEEEWQCLSRTIRREHECLHYLTRRLFGSMENRLHDELIADYAGIVAAAERYRADWFLRFMGLEEAPPYGSNGRLKNYRGDPPLSDGAFRVLQTLVRDAARNVERWDEEHRRGGTEEEDRVVLFLAIASQSLEELASEEAVNNLRQKVES